MIKRIFLSFMVVAAALRLFADAVLSWEGTKAPVNEVVFRGITLSELKGMVDAKTHYLASEMSGSAFDGGTAQSADFWADSANGDGSWNVQIQCVYKNDLRFVNLRLEDDGNGNIKATQISQNWCSGSSAAFKGYVTNPTHTGSWTPGATHYFAKSLAVSDINDCEAEIGGVKYKTLNEAKLVAMSAPAGSDGKMVTLLRDKTLWTSTYIENFTLVVPEGVTFSLANDDVAKTTDPNAGLIIKGTLDIQEGCHITVGQNVLELYSGARLEGIGDNLGLMFVSDTKEIPVKLNPNSQDRTVFIDGDVTSNVDITFNIEDGVRLVITGGVNPKETGHTVNKTGNGELIIEGIVGGSYTVTKTKDLDVGTIAYGTEFTVESFGGVITNSDSKTDRNATKAQMCGLRMSDDTRITGCNFGMIKNDYAVTVLDLGGHTLTIDMLANGDWKTRNFYLANTTIKNGGEIVLNKGDLVLYAKDSTMNTGVLRLKQGAVLNPNNFTFSLNDLVNDGGTISASGRIRISGTSTGASTIYNLEMCDNSTIKLNGADVLKVTGAFAANGRLNLDLSDYLIVDKSIDIAETPDPVVVLPAGYTTAQTQAVIDNIILVEPKIRTGCALVADGNVIKIKAMVSKNLYWNAWRGTFWEIIGGNDVNGNHGFARDEEGIRQAILTGDTIIFDKDHYQKDGKFVEQTDYWHFDENLYIKNEVRPGANNDWDLMVLQGVTLKLGLRGARATGQNVISDLKIYIEAGSTMELGYWGNTHHYEGVIRDEAKFGGTGTIRFGNDLGPSLRIEGDVRGDTQAGFTTVDANGRELILCGKDDGSRTEIALSIAGLGTLAAKNDGIHITGDVDFGDDAVIDATSHLVSCDREVSFGSSLAVKLNAAPVGAEKVKILDCGSATFNDTRVRVIVGGSPVAAFYELVQGADGVYVQVRQVRVHYDASAAEGYDFAGALVTVTMDPAIQDLPVTVVVKDENGNTVLKDDGDWSDKVQVKEGGSGSAVVMLGDEDRLDLFASNQHYDYTVSIGDQELSGSFFVGNLWFSASAESGESVVSGGIWRDAAPEISAGRYTFTSENHAFAVASDRAADELGYIEQVVSFAEASDDSDLTDVSLAEIRSALTIAEDADGVPMWKGVAGGKWVSFVGAEPTVKVEHLIRTEYDRKGASRMRYLVDGLILTSAGVTDDEGWFSVSGALSALAYIGSGTVARVEAAVDNPALASFDGVKYMSMESAVSAWRKDGSPSDRPIRLLTNVFFAPEPGIYCIDRCGFSIRMTNDMIIRSENGTSIDIGFPEVIDGYGNGEFGIFIGGEWLGHAIPWKTRRQVQAELLKKGVDSPFARWQTYVLGFAADETDSATCRVRGVQTAEADTIVLDDGLLELSKNITGVVVKRVLCEGSKSGTVTPASDTEYDADGRLPVVRLGEMDGNVRYYKLGYEFEQDRGQDDEEEQ